MNGDPVDPITFEAATRLVWERLSGDADLDLRQHLLGTANREADGGVSEEDGPDDDGLPERLFSDARLAVEGAVIVGLIRTWAAEGEAWRRPTPQAVLTRLQSDPDVPSGLYVDRQELLEAAARYPGQFGSEGPAAMPVVGAAGPEKNAAADPQKVGALMKTTILCCWKCGSYLTHVRLSHSTKQRKWSLIGQRAADRSKAK